MKIESQNMFLMKRKQIVLKIFIFLTLAILLERIYFLHNRGFSLSKLISKQPSIHVSPSPEIDALLDQDFHWMDSGGTCYVFLGEDGKTILKFFKYHQLYFKHFLYHLPFPGASDAWRIGTILSREKKHWHKRHPSFFHSCTLVSKHLKEDTGVIYLCPQPNLHFNRNIKLIDAWGIPRYFNLSQTGFALQKKAQLLFPHLEELLKENRIEEGKRAIDSLISLIARRCHKGIGDRDPNLRINFGFVEGKAVEFDIGSYYSDPSLNSPFKTRRELFFTTVLLQNFLAKHSPTLLNYLLEQIANKPLA